MSGGVGVRGARLLVALGLLGPWGAVARAGEPFDQPAPFLIRNLNPFIQVYGLPPFDPVGVTPGEHAQLQLALDAANSSKLGSGPNESITLDGETYRLALTVRVGLADRVEAGIEVPFLFHRHGVFDPFIEDWHAFFGFPNGDRTQMPDNVLDYSHQLQGQESIAIRTPQQGLGDVRLFAATTLYGDEDGRRALSLRGSLKLPTGDPARLLGSGSTDLAVSVHAAASTLSSGALTWYGRLGLLGMSQGDVLATQQRHLVAFGGLGLDWRLGRVVDLKVQLDSHGPCYKSELPQLGATSVMITVGGTIRFAPGTTLDLAVGENLFIDAIPDVIVNLTLSQRL